MTSNSEQSKNIFSRNSSLELLKIIAIIFIVISHSLPDGYSEEIESVIVLSSATRDVNSIIMLTLKNLGQIGNNIFIICSAWFLLDSKKVNVYKVAYMIADCFIISIIMLSCFLGIGYDFYDKYIIKQIFPTTFGSNWFITCYLLLYCIHPILNKVIENLEKRELLRLDVVFFILYCFLNFMELNGIFYYNYLIGFIVIYFFVAYIKIYLGKYVTKRTGIYCIMFGFIGWIFQNIVTNWLGLYITLFSNNNMYWNRFINPCYILIVIGLVFIVKEKNFSNNVINYVSSLSFLVYVIHNNRIINDYLRYDIYDYIYDNYSYDNLLIYILLFAIALLLFGVVCAILYNKTLQIIVKNCTKKIVYYMKNIYVKIEDFLVNL